MSAPTMTVATDPPPPHEPGGPRTPPVRVRRAPPLEPPFDDEPDPAWHPATVAPPPHPLAQPGRGPRTQRPVTPRPMRGPADPLPARLQPTPGAVAAQRFIGVCIEILNGHRAVSHLRAVTAPGDLKQITDQLVARTNRAYLGRPGRTAPGPQRVRLMGLRICEPLDGVVEVAAVLAYGIQTWAMAVRMERPAETWLCKLIQVI